MAVNPAILNALTLEWGRKKADLDDQENRTRINYNGALDSMRRNYDQTTLRSREGLADRGMLQSGPALASATRLQDDYNRQQADASQATNLNLSTLARRRLDADSEFNMQKVLASLGISGR